MTAPRRLATVLLALAWLTIGLGCSATYRVARVSDINEANVTHPGLYYRLPKTQVLVAIPVTRKSATPGKYVGHWDDCSARCTGHPNASCSIGDGKAIKSYELGNPKVLTRAVADPAHTYKLDIEFSTFAGFNHLLKFNDQGILTSATTDFENHSVEVAAATAKTLVQLAAVAADVSTPMESCSDFLQAQKQYDTYAKARADLNSRLDRLLYDSSGRLTGPAVVEIVKHHDSRLKQLAEDAQDVLDARRTQKEDKLLGFLLTRIEPEELKDYAVDAEHPLTWAYTSQIDANSLPPWESVEPLPQELSTILQNVQREITLSLNRAAADTATVNCETGNDKQCGTVGDRGYRYRIPTTAVLTIVRAQNPAPVALATARLPIAQYGPLVSLPAEVSRMKSKLNIELSDTLGSLRQAEVGATPQAATAQTQFLDIARDEITRRKDAKEKARTEAENAGKDALTKERDLLKLKKEIKDLQDGLADDSKEGAGG